MGRIIGKTINVFNSQGKMSLVSNLSVHNCTVMFLMLLILMNKIRVLVGTIWSRTDMVLISGFYCNCQLTPLLDTFGVDLV